MAHEGAVEDPEPEPTTPAPEEPTSAPGSDGDSRDLAEG
jgi:hypothetical protein